MVALSAWPFCSSQYCTALSSWIRFSTSSTLSVGATQLDKLGIPGTAPAPPDAAGLVRFLRKSKPGTNWLKSKAWVVSLMVSPSVFLVDGQLTPRGWACQCLCPCDAAAAERTGTLSSSELLAPFASSKRSVSGTVLPLVIGCFRSISMTW